MILLIAANKITASYDPDFNFLTKSKKNKAETYTQ